MLLCTGSRYWLVSRHLRHRLYMRLMYVSVEMTTECRRASQLQLAVSYTGFFILIRSVDLAWKKFFMMSFLYQVVKAFN